MSATQPDNNDRFRSVVTKVGDLSVKSGSPIEVFSTHIENAHVLDSFKPQNLVDFRTNLNVPATMRNQNDPDSRWRLIASFMGIEVAYSKEFFNWKLWGLNEKSNAALRTELDDNDPCYLSDYGGLGLEAKNAAVSLGLMEDERFYFCVEFISARVATTALEDLGLFGAWLQGAKIDPQYVQRTAREALLA